MAGGDYGRIRHTFWTDPDIKRGLNVEQKALLLYYFTSPHSSLVGLYYCPLEYISVETGIPVERVREATFGPLSKYVTYDEATEEIFVHRAGRHQVGDDLQVKDRRVKAIQKVIAETHSSRLVAKFLELYAHWPLNVENPPPEAPSKPLRSHSSSSAVAVQEQSSAAAEPLRDEPAAGSPDALRLRVELEAHADEMGYDASDRLMAIGEDLAVWKTTGEVVPMVDRLRCLRLADAHLSKPGSKAADLRSALRYVLVQQYDPIPIEKAADRKGRADPAAPSPIFAVQSPKAEMARLAEQYPDLYPVVLADLERYPWWNPLPPTAKVDEMRKAIKERIQPPLSLVR